MRESPWSAPRGLQHVRRSLRELVSPIVPRKATTSAPSAPSAPTPAPRPTTRASLDLSRPPPAVEVAPRIAPMLPPQRATRRVPTYRPRDYPEHLNPFRDDPVDEPPVDDDEPELRPTQNKFGTWTVPRRRSHLNFDTWGSNAHASGSQSRSSREDSAAVRAAPSRPTDCAITSECESGAPPRPLVRLRKKRRAPPPPTLAFYQRSSLSSAVSLPQLSEVSQLPSHLPQSTSQVSLSSEERVEGACEGPQARSRAVSPETSRANCPGVSPKASRTDCPKASPEAGPSPEASRRGSPNASPEASPSPEASRRDSPKASPEASPSPEATCRDSPKASPEASPIPEASRRDSPKASPEASRRDSRKATPETSPSPEACRRGSFTASPEASPRDSPKASPRVSPRDSPKASPRISPEASPRESPAAISNDVSETSPRGNPGCSPDPGRDREEAVALEARPESMPALTSLHEFTLPLREAALDAVPENSPTPSPRCVPVREIEGRSESGGSTEHIEAETEPADGHSNELSACENSTASPEETLDIGLPDRGGKPNSSTTAMGPIPECSSPVFDNRKELETSTPSPTDARSNGIMHTKAVQV